MPYSSNSELPPSVRDKYSDHCQSVFRNTWNSVHDRTGDEGRAFAEAHAAAKRCEGSKTMTIDTKMTPTFKLLWGDRFDDDHRLKAFDSPDGRPRLRGVASSTVRDLHGDIMTQSAIDDMVRAANGNMTVFLNHEYKVPEDIFGSVENATTRPFRDGTEAGVEMVYDLLVDDTNARAMQAYNSVKRGSKLGLSVGALIPEGGAHKNKDGGGWIIEHVELLETSLVSIPANQRSWVEFAAKSLFSTGDAISLGEDSPGVALLLSHGELPDSAFACISPGGTKEAGKTRPLSLRHYPHHTASGGVDPGLLRSALSRIGDPSNEQCGKAHLEAHAKSLGMGERSEKALGDVDFVDAITDDFDIHHFLTEAADSESDAPLQRQEFEHDHEHAHTHNHEHSHDDGAMVHGHEHSHLHAHGHQHGGADDHPHDEAMNHPDHNHDHNNSTEDHPHNRFDAKDSGDTDNDADEPKRGLDPDRDKKDTEPSLTAAKVTVTVETDPPQQEASKSDPVNADALADEDADGEDELLGDTVTQSLPLTSSLGEMANLLSKTAIELVETKRALAAALTAKDDAVRARRKAETERREVLSKTKSLLDRLADEPLVRRTAVAVAQKSFRDQFSGVYDEEFIKVLEHHTDG